MKPVEFPEQTVVFGKPAGWKDEDCGSLPIAQTVYSQSDGSLAPNLLSYWEQELTDDQIATIVRTRKTGVWVSICGTGMPPISISLESPFPEGYDKEQALASHKKFWRS